MSDKSKYSAGSGSYDKDCQHDFSAGDSCSYCGVIKKDAWQEPWNKPMRAQHPPGSPEHRKEIQGVVIIGDDPPQKNRDPAKEELLKQWEKFKKENGPLIMEDLVGSNFMKKLAEEEEENSPHGPPQKSQFLIGPEHREENPMLITPPTPARNYEMEIIQLLISRTIMGARQYGKFDPTKDKRNLARELLQEIVDSLFYVGGLTIQLEELLASVK